MHSLKNCKANIHVNPIQVKKTNIVTTREAPCATPPKPSCRIHPAPHIAFNCHVFLFSPVCDSSSFFIFHNLDIFEKCWPFTLQNVPQFVSFDMCLSFPLASFYEHFTLASQDVPGSFSHFPAPDWNQSFLRGALVPFTRMVFRNQYLSTN